MDQDLEKQISSRLDELPDDVREAILSSEFEKKIQTIGTKHKLHIDQVGKLSNETMLTMLGFTNTEGFVDSVTEHLDIPNEQAGAVATDINNEIFGPIRESLKRFAEQATAAPAPVSPHLSVAMPSQTPKPPTSPSPAPTPPPAPATAAPAKPAPPPAVAPKPQVPLAPHPHDLMLVEKTVTTPATPPKTPAPPTTPAPGGGAPQPPKPAGYKADPYREPPE